jgi:excisionase family DNA binding protein
MSRHISDQLSHEDEREYMRTHEVARILRISQGQVMRLMRRKVLPGFRLGRVWLVRRKELEQYLANLQRGAN